MILKVENLQSKYGLSQVLFDIGLEVSEGESVCILGRNGVGKSTTLKTIIGDVKACGGSIVFNGENIIGLPAYKISRKGLAFVPQGRHIFPNLTVRENLIMAQRNGVDGRCNWTFEKIHELFPILKTRANQKGRQLSGGEQQMLAISRGLLQNPKLLLLDEICEGLAPIVVQELAEVIQELRERKVSILIAEQSVKFATKVSDRCYIIEKGKVVYHGDSSGIPHEVFVKHLGA